jgi:hypothetical protein
MKTASGLYGSSRTAEIRFAFQPGPAVAMTRETPLFYIGWNNSGDLTAAHPR